jgi:methionyl-tRNA formyltransferase
MRIAVLTMEDPLYLPRVFDRLLLARAGDIACVCACRPIYKDLTALSMVRRYWRAFGTWNLLQLVVRRGWTKFAGIARWGESNGRFHTIKRVCARHGVPYEQPRDVNDPAFLDHLRELGIDLIVSITCPQIFGDALIELPPKGCLNVHGAKLPEYRGLLPSFWMLADGVEEAGVTIFQVTEKLDLGLIVGQRTFPIRNPRSLHEFIIESKQHVADLLLEVFDAVESGTTERRPMAGKGSYRGWPTRADYRRFRSRGLTIW